MNEKAVQVAYNLFVKDGYNKDINSFKALMQTNEKARAVAHNLFVKDGYTKDINSFSSLMGVGAQPEQQIQSTTIEAPAAEVKKKDEAVPSSNATPSSSPSSPSPSSGQETAINIYTALYDRLKENPQTSSRAETLAKILTAQAAVEAGTNFDSDLAKKSNNYSGIKYFGQKGVTPSDVTAPSSEEKKNGKKYARPYAHFNSMEDWADHMVNKMITEYPEAMQANSAAEYARALKADPHHQYYQSDEKKYLAGLNAQMHKFNLLGDNSVPQQINTERQNSFFNNSIQNITGDLIGREQEEVTAKLNYQFGSYGFKFTPTGGSMADDMLVTAPNGKTISINLDTWFSDNKGAAELRDFMTINKPQQSSIDKIEKSYKQAKTKFTSEQDMKNTISSYQEETKNFKTQVVDFIKRKDALSLEIDRYNKLPESEKSLPQNINLQKSLQDRANKIKSESNILINKEKEIEQKGKSLDKSVGEYTAMLGEQGDLWGGIQRSFLGGAGAVLSGMGTLVTQGMFAALPLQSVVDQKVYREVFEKAAQTKKINVPANMTDEQFTKWANGLKNKDEIESLATDYAKKKVLYGDGINEFSNEATKQLRQNEGLTSTLRNALPQAYGTSNTTKEYLESKQRNFWENALFGTAASVPAMMGNRYTRPAQFFAMGYDMINKEMADNPKFANVSENEKMVVSMPMGIVAGILEEMGVRNVLNRSSLVTGITMKILGNASKDLTAATFKDLVRTEVKNGFLRGAITLGTAGLAEGETGLAQQLSEDAIKRFYNNKHKAEYFEGVPEFKEVLKESKKALVSGAAESIGGLIFGSIHAGVAGFTKQDFSMMDDKKFNTLLAASRDQNIVNAFLSSVDADVSRGKITQEQGQRTKDDYQSLVNTLQTIPDNISDENKKKAISILARRNELINRIEGKDPHLVKSEIETIKKLNGELSTMPRTKYVLNGKEMTRNEFVNEVSQMDEESLKKMTATVENDNKTTQALADLMNIKVTEQGKVEIINGQQKTQEQNAIQEPSTTESVLRTEQTQMGLQEVGQGNIQEQATSEEVSAKEKEIEAQKEKEIKDKGLDKVFPEIDYNAPENQKLAEEKAQQEKDLQEINDRYNKMLDDVRNTEQVTTQEEVTQKEATPQVTPQVTPQEEVSVTEESLRALPQDVKNNASITLSDGFEIPVQGNEAFVHRTYNEINAKPESERTDWDNKTLQTIQSLFNPQKTSTTEQATSQEGDLYFSDEASIASNDFMNHENTQQIDFDEIASRETDPMIKRLYDILKPYTRNGKIYYQDGYNFMPENGIGYGATIDGKGNVLIFDSKLLNTQTVMHELMHDLLFDAIENNTNQKFTDEINRIFNKAKQNQDLVDRYSYAFTNNHEFISEVFGDKNFRQELSYIQDDNNNKSTNIFQSISDAIKQFLFDEYNFNIDKTLLDSIFDSVDSVIKNKNKSKKESKSPPAISTTTSTIASNISNKADLVTNITSKIEEIRQNSSIESLDMRKKRDDANALLKNLSNEYINSLSIPEAKDLLNVLDDITNGIFSNTSLIIKENAIAFNNAKQLINAINEASPAPITNLYSKIKSIFTRESASRETVRRTPLYYVSEVLGVKGQKLYKLVFENMAKVRSAYSTEMGSINKQIEQAQVKLSKSFNNNMDKFLASKMKIYAFLVQQEFESNPDNDKLVSVDKHIEATIKQINKGQSTTYGDKESAALKEILDDIRYIDDEGNISAERMFAFMTPAEQKAVKEIQDAYKKLKDKSIYTATVVRGTPLEMLNDYNHLNVTLDRNELNEEDQSARDISEIQSAINPSTKAKSLITRKGGAHPLLFDPFAALNKSAKGVLLDYHMTSAIRETRGMLNQVAEQMDRTTEDGKLRSDIFNAMNDSFDDVINNILVNLYGADSFGDKVMQDIKRFGYRVILASAPRFASELTSNVSFAVYNPTIFAKGMLLAKDGIITRPDAVMIMVNLGAVNAERLYSSEELSGRMVDQSLLTQKSGITRNKFKGTVGNRSEQIYNNTIKKYKNSVEFLADTLIATPDKLVGRPIWFGAFATKFEELTGQSPDFDMIAENNEDYMNNYKDVLTQSTDFADRKSVEASASNNEFLGILKGTQKGTSHQKQSALMQTLVQFNNFLSRFNIFDYHAARKGIYAMMGSGDISRAEGAKLLAAVATRSTSYIMLSKILGSVMLQMIVDSLGYMFDIHPPKKHKKEEKTIIQQGKSAFANALLQLTLGRDFGNVTRAVINYGSEEANKKYGEQLGFRTGKYDASRDRIGYTPISTDSKDKIKPLDDYIVDMSGAFAPMAQTGKFAFEKYRALQNRKSKRLTKRDLYDIHVRIPLEITGNIGLIPFYKDVRRGMFEFMPNLPTKKVQDQKPDENILRRYFPEIYQEMHPLDSEMDSNKKEISKNKRKQMDETFGYEGD